jgi:hypothetical protein
MYSMLRSPVRLSLWRAIVTLTMAGGAGDPTGTEKAVGLSTRSVATPARRAGWVYAKALVQQVTVLGKEPGKRKEVCSKKWQRWLICEGQDASACQLKGWEAGG